MPKKYCMICRAKSSEGSILAPRDEKRRELWSSITGVEFTRTSTICGKHFKDSDFNFKKCGNSKTRRRLKPTAVPQKPEPAQPKFTEHMSSACGDNVFDFSSQTEQEIVNSGLALENMRLQKKITDLQRENAKLLEELGKTQMLTDSLNTIFTKSQVRKLENGGKRVQWNHDDISNAVCLHAAGPRAYRHLINKGFPLPSLSTLDKWLSSVDIQPGMLDFVISLMENAVDVYEEDKICIIYFDEMKVRSKNENEHSLEAEQEPRDYVQVAMAQGLRKSWNYPLYFDFDKPMTVSTLHMLIEKLYMVGYHVVGVVSYMKPRNYQLWTNLQVSPEKTWFEHPADSAKKVYVFADVPHLAQLIRNHFLDSGLVDTPSSGRQRVKLATELFSNTTASAIKHCQSLGLNGHKASEKADFIQLVNDWFDVFNVKQSTSLTIPTKQPFGMNLEAQRQVLSKMSQAVSQVIVPDGKTSLPFQKGVLISNSSLDELLKYVADRYNVKYLITSRISKDQLEQFFDAMRVKGGPHVDPSPLEFKSRIRKYLIGKNFIDSSD